MKPFTDREKEYMRDNKDDFYGHTATRLGELFPEDNGGSRAQASVRRFLK